MSQEKRKELVEEILIAIDQIRLSDKLLDEEKILIFKEAYNQLQNDEKLPREK